MTSHERFRLEGICHLRRRKRRTSKYIIQIKPIILPYIKFLARICKLILAQPYAYTIFKWTFIEILLANYFRLQNSVSESKLRSRFEKLNFMTYILSQWTVGATKDKK